MNWDAISFDWNQVRAFLATAEEGSFSSAARALKTTQPTIGRQISELEGVLGVTLFERSVKGPTLTESAATLRIMFEPLERRPRCYTLLPVVTHRRYRGRLR